MKCLEKDRSRRYETANGLARDVAALSGGRIGGSVSAVGRLSPRQVCPAEQRAVLAASIIFSPAGRRHRGHDLGTGSGRSSPQGGSRSSRGREEGQRAVQKRLQQIEKGSEILASIFGDLDPRRRRRKAGRCGRSWATGSTARPPSWKETQSATPSSWPICKIDWAGPTGPWATPPRRRRCSRRPSRSAEPSSARTTRTHSRSCPSRPLALNDAGELNDAIALFEQVRDAQVRILGADHRDTLATRHNLAVAYWKAGRASEACRPARTGPGRPVGETRART